MGYKLFLLWAGLSMGNIIFALVTSGPAEKIFERSFFQGVALLAAYFMMK